MSILLNLNDEELAKNFFILQTKDDIAKLLDISYSRLKYHLYSTLSSKRYCTFNISKKGGGTRQISAPANALKIIQIKLNQVLQSVYPAKPSVHGFIRNRNILSNAMMHSKKRYVLNLDLENFFPSINFGRVRGMFMAYPYKRNEKVATILAQICCFENSLPQGAPTSPIVSNMICAKMDSQMQRFAKENECYYTRYCDDITYSTYNAKFIKNLVVFNQPEKIEIAPALKNIINDNGFKINQKKVRLLFKGQRQEVTGLTVNEFPNVRRKYIRQIRAMLNAWQKYGHDAAEKEFQDKFDKKHRNPLKAPPSFKFVVKGKIEFLGMIRGKDNAIYIKFLKTLQSLDPDLVKRKLPPDRRSKVSKIIITTEGKSDWKHLKAALIKLKKIGQYKGLTIEFDEFQVTKGDIELKKECEMLFKKYQTDLLINIFDRDNPKILDEISLNGHNYKSWGNNVFSYAIPIPDHRKKTPSISLEFYYKDDEIIQPDKNGRRLYINNEFRPKSGQHKKDNLTCLDRNKIKEELAIIDDKVIDKDENNIALSKDDFAENILKGVAGYDNFDITQFSKIFDVISQIIQENMAKP